MEREKSSAVSADESDRSHFMRIALEEAATALREGNHGFGAIVVRGTDVLAQAHDTEGTENDPTGHAEITAIRESAKRVGHDLRGCTLVSTHEPCPMCATAAVWAGIESIAYGFSIRDAIAQGRRRIDISCREIYLRAGKPIVIHEDVLRDRCAVLYDAQVRSQVRALRSVDEAALGEMARALSDKRLRWIDQHPSALQVEGETLPMRAYRLLTRKLGIDESEAPIVSHAPNSLTFASRNFCPTLEACRILRLDTRWVCRALTEGPTQALLQRLDPRLRFTRDYASLRPHGETCLETISVLDH